MIIKKGILKAWFSGTCTANIQIGGSGKAYLEGIKVARNIPSAEMIAGRNVAVVFWDKSNAEDAVIIGVYG
ncbi:MAG: hypothetical protein JXA46_04655 [Dehalococcoidales bacterium]|nr:hypothetical protein [Dehalococcoidales bacterium]